MSASHPSALVTGASSGIGLAVSKLLLDNNYRVEGVARSFAAGVCDGLIKTEMDLSNLDQLKQNLKSYKDAPEVLVLNAGYGQFGGLEQFSHEQIQSLINTNLVCNLFLLKHFLPLMKVKGLGDIVLIGSESGLQGAKMGAVYCATKFAIRGLAQSLRADCAGSNIRVILVNPGPVSSNFFDELNFEPQAGQDFAIEPESIAETVLSALQQPRNVVLDEINIQPIKRSFSKKK